MSIALNQLTWVARIATDVDAPPIAAISRAGITNVELMLPSDFHSAFDIASARTAELSIQLRSAGMTTSVLNLRHDNAIDLGRPLGKSHDAAIERIIQVMDLAANIGANTISITPAAVIAGDGSSVNRYEDAFGHSIRSLSVLRFEAAMRCIRIACRIGVAGFLLSPMDTRMWLDAVNSPWIGARIDPVAIASAGCPIDWLQSLGHRIVMIDYVDSASDSNALRSTSVDWPSLMRACRSNNNARQASVSTSIDDLDAAAALMHAETQRASS